VAHLWGELKKGDGMAKTRILNEFGMGSSLRRTDYTEAALRAIKDALWHNSVSVAPAPMAPA